MTLGWLILRNTVRRPVRLGLTVGGLAMVVLAFGLIRLTLDQWQAGSRAALKNRLITVHAMSDELRLPLAYKDRLTVIPGARTVTLGRSSAASIKIRNSRSVRSPSRPPRFSRPIPRLS